MPELPEVHTTIEGLKKQIIGKVIKEGWSDFHIKTAHGHRNNLKNEKYYKDFKKKVVGAKIISLGRIGKNILINLSNKETILVHMKMTGHLMVGSYILQKYARWVAIQKGPLQDPYNQFIHFVLTLSDGSSKDSKQIKHLVLSDMRKFASVEIRPTASIENYLSLGPDSLSISKEEFFERISKRKNSPIKSTLMDQKIIAGLGNIYSDEILWEASVHPLSSSDKIPKAKMQKMHSIMQKMLAFSIKHGGDSKSDYRNAFGEKGGFQNFHKVYGRKEQKCPKPKCGGIIERKMIRGRSAHFCPKHQIIYK